MSVKNDITTALQLFLLLCILYWSLTWNLPPNFDPIHQSSHGGRKKPKLHSRNAEVDASDSIQYWNKHYLILESFRTAKNVGKSVLEISSSGGSVIPSFNEWKKEQLTKQEKLQKEKEELSKKKRPSRRKLNYSSSKCGAKVLASNPEAKHRIAILNEQADEYMLNPCHSKFWFVIELCDTIEATQIELANYELYSSSPKKFAVFWSEIFPTQVWHHLGTFEATNQRTMQSFDIHGRNLGKFFKIIIFSHHGKEHYCPLSVVRILGYSVAYEFEENENNEKSSEDLERYDHRNLTSIKKAQNKSIDKRFKFAQKIKTSSLPSYSIYCADQKESDGSCLNRPFCRVLKEIMQRTCYRVYINDFYSKNKTLNRAKSVFIHDEDLQKPKFKNSCLQCSAAVTLRTNINQKRNSKFLSSSIFDILCLPSKSRQKNPPSEDRKMAFTNTKSENRNYKGISKTTANITEMVKNASSEFHTHKKENKKTLQVPKTDCICEQMFENSHGIEEPNLFLNVPDSYYMEDGLDSAGLIQKESVLVRLTARIKASETNLDLINKYLQHLSQSYRRQMEDMQILFNETVKAVTLASERALIIDNKQHEELALIQNKVHFLNNKIDYLINEQKDSLKLVMELHAFFLVLQLTIISTICTIVLNNLHQKCCLAEKVILNSKREKLYYNIMSRNSRYVF